MVGLPGRIAHPRYRGGSLVFGRLLTLRLYDFREPAGPVRGGRGQDQYIYTQGALPTRLPAWRG